MSSITALRWVTLAGILFWLVGYWQAGIKIVIDIKESIRSGNSRLDTALLIVLALCSIIIISLGLLANLKLLQVDFLQNVVVTSIGTLLSVSGIAGMFYCRYHLGKFWTAETNIARNHQVIDTGPYRFVRHPIYAFAILMYIGLGLVFPSPWSASFVAVIVTAYILKAKEEDFFLEKNLPGYREYKSRVRYHLVPGAW